jgi:hypothetical protein
MVLSRFFVGIAIVEVGTGPLAASTRRARFRRLAS